MPPLDEDPGPARVRVHFEPDGANPRDVRVPAGVSVFDAASWNGIAIDSTCGGHGTCRKCKIRVLDGAVPVSRLDPRAFDPEQLTAGWRLACMASAEHDIRVHVPPLVTRPKAATVGVGRQVILRPAVQKRHVELAEPTLTDQRSDAQRLWDALDDLELRTDLHVMRRLTTVLRAADYEVTAVIVDDVLIDVEPGDTTARRFGIAYDLGTTTVVATLLDLATGTPVAVGSMLNPQQPFGADVITRISATMMDPRALDQLAALARQGLHQLATEVCADGGVELTEVYEVALAGNATMTHIALGIDPESLGVAPFVMTSRGVRRRAGERHRRRRAPRCARLPVPRSGRLRRRGHRVRRAGLRDGPGQAHAAVHRRGHELRDRPLHADRLLATAAPAGPAFEGAAIRCGMRAAGGAIEGVKISDDDVSLQVIGDVEPVGLCGSGLVDAVAALVQAKLLDASGRLSGRGDRRADPSRAGRPAAQGRAKSVSSCCTGPAARGDMAGRSTCPSGTCASCSSPRRPSPPAGGCCSRRSGWPRRTSSRCCWPARSAATWPRPARCASASCRASRRCASSARATWRARAPRWPCCPSANGRARGLLEEVHYVELSDRPDFNDRFVDELAFPV